MTDQPHTLRLALNDPGAFVERRDGETLVEWQTRAVSTYLRERADDVPRTLRGSATHALRKLANLIDERKA